MDHRHLTAHDASLAAVDDLIARGGWPEWVALRRDALADNEVLRRVAGLCVRRLTDPDASQMRYGFWLNYARAHGVDG